MTDYHVELHRRTSQFSDCLERMHQRAHNEVHGNCFIIFEEASPDLDTDEPREEATAELIEILGGARGVAEGRSGVEAVQRAANNAGGTYASELCGRQWL